MSTMADITYDIDNDTCNICNAEFLDNEDLKLHMLQYHLTNTSKDRFCKFCSIIFASIDDFALHIRNEHLTELESCRYCCKLYLNGDLLSKHEKKHKNSVHFLKYLCSQCEATFDSQIELENHEFEHHKDADEGIMLQHCFASLSSLLNMNIRRFLEVSHGDFLYICAICDMSTPECSLYIKHLKDGKCRSFACNQCCNVYMKKKSLREHCRRHLLPENVNTSKYKKQCLKCSKLYTSKDLEKHVKVCDIIKCRQCSQTFNSISDLANHITIHSQKAPVQFVSCKYCRKPVISADVLEKHIERTHKHNLHLYKYNCIHCDIVFKHPKLLFGHFFTKHKDIQPYTCKICNKKFRLRKKFTLHIKLDHKSVGFVEFDDNFHVCFTDKKSVNSQNMLKMKESFANNLDLIKKPSTESEVQKTVDKEMEGPHSELTKEVTTTTTTIVENTTSEDVEEEIHGKSSENIEKEKNLDYCITEEDQTKTQDEHKKETEEKRNSLEELVFENIEVLEPDLIESDDNSTLLVERKKRKYTKKSKKPPKKDTNIDSDIDSDDSDEPLYKLGKIQKRGRPKAPWNKGAQKSPRSKKFMCLKCNTYCYTYQNYDRHMSLHKKNQIKSCIKCVRQFKTTEDLVHHIKTEHATSKLTETLKKMLDQRKKDEHEIYVSEKFLQTMHKVPVTRNTSQATIKRVDNKLSVKKFWENFTPDEGRKEAKISIRPVTAKPSQPLIKLTKFTPETPTKDAPKLKMPTKFTERTTEQYNVSIKLVHCDLAPSALNFHNEITITDINYNDLENQSRDIPEMAHEIMLEETEIKNVKYIKKTVILKDLLRYNNVRIGHLAPQAPFYKIVKIDDVLQEEKAKEPAKPDKVVLPDGTKLVNVNPLAHLLNKKDIKEICKSSLNSKSTAKVQNFSEAIYKAMTVLDKPLKKRVRRVENENPIALE